MKNKLSKRGERLISSLCSAVAEDTNQGNDGWDTDVIEAAEKNYRKARKSLEMYARKLEEIRGLYNE